MNTIRNLKQQEKYDKMLKRKNKEKNIYKSKNSTLRIEKMNLIKAIERKDKEIERLNNIINELEKWLEEDLKQVYRDAGYRHNLIFEVLDKLQELKGSDK